MVRADAWRVLRAMWPGAAFAVGSGCRAGHVVTVSLASCSHVASRCGDTLDSIRSPESPLNQLGQARAGRSESVGDQTLRSRSPSRGPRLRRARAIRRRKYL